MNIEQLEYDENITPISDYVKEEDLEIVQQKLFD